jgi:hypothetical protein
MWHKSPMNLSEIISLYIEIIVIRERQSPSQIRALARSALEERPPRAAEEAVASRLKRKFRLDNVDLRESSSKSEGRLGKVDSEVGINDKDKGSFRIIGLGGLSTGKTKEERIASIARRGLFPDERQRLPKKKSPVKKKLQSHSPGNDIMTNELSLFESTATADVTAIFAAHDSKNQIGTFASTNFSGLSSSLKSNVYMYAVTSKTFIVQSVFQKPAAGGYMCALMAFGPNVTRLLMYTRRRYF